MQKLYSMFPSGTPGLALALLRCTLAMTWWTIAASASTELRVALAAMLTVGLFTPLSASVLACCVLVGVLMQPGTFALPALTLSLSATVAMLGPGAYSLDARMFARRIVWPQDGDLPN